MHTTALASGATENFERLQCGAVRRYFVIRQYARRSFLNHLRIQPIARVYFSPHPTPTLGQVDQM